MLSRHLFAVAAVLRFGAAVFAADAPPRFMPFLCRDAVVREGAEKAVLADAGKKVFPVLVLGRAPDGPRASFERGQISRAATQARKFILKITDVDCRVADSPAAAERFPGPRIYLGTAGDPAVEFPELAKADAHGFVIATRPGKAGRDLHIVSMSGTGVLYGVNFFLMNYAGLRIVLPHEIGEVYQKSERLEVPAGLYVLNPGPDFLLRIWSGPSGFATTDWLADAGGTQRFEYHHNMHRVYDPARFGKDHPEYYPMKEGKYAVPDPKSDAAWQPTFSNAATARRAIEYADEHFTARPDMLSMSLTVNDGLGYFEADMKKGTLAPDGRISISNVYFDYLNTVARAVKEKWPGRYVAFLPYNLVAQPPDFGLEDNVMVFLFNEPKTSFAEWQGKVSNFGIYQWLYGFHWVIPNHWPHAIQDYLRWVRAHGGKAFKGEAYVAWSQAGPRMWALNNLLWNTDADVDALLDDYYRHCYGPDAAPAMARFFAQAEKIYERRRTSEEYRITIYKPGARQFEHVTPNDIRVMSDALEEALAKAKGEADRARVDLTARCFRWGRFYWDQHQALRAMSEANVASEADVQAVLSAPKKFHAIPAERDAYYEEFIKPKAQYCIYANAPDKIDPAHLPEFRWDDFDAQVDKVLAAVTAFWRTTMTPQQAATRWEDAGKRDASLKPFADSERLRLIFPDARLKNQLPHGSFERPDAPAAKKPWPKAEYAAADWAVYHNRMVNATVSLDPRDARDGKVSVTARGLTDYSGVMGLAQVKNHARYRLTFWYKTSPETRHVSYSIMRQPPIREHADPSPEWKQVERVFTVNNPGGDLTSFSILLCLRHGGSEKSQAWFDDVRLELLAPEGME